MPAPRRKLQATAEETLTPPPDLSATQSIGKIVSATGNNLYSVELPGQEKGLFELQARFRSTIWLKRGGFVLVDLDKSADRDNKIDGEIINVVRDEKAWRKEKYWPKEFAKRLAINQGDDEESSRAGQMPPHSDEEI